jgi:integrase/recombinase XerD
MIAGVLHFTSLRFLIQISVFIQITFKEMANPKVFRNGGYEKKDGTSAVYVIVHLMGESLKFATGVNCTEAEWNVETGRLRGNSKKAKDDNLIIDRTLATVNEIMVRYRLAGEQLTPELLKNEYRNPTRRIDFYSFVDEAIKERKPDLAKQTVKNHFTMVEKLKEYRPKLAFADITPDFLQGFARWMKNTRKNDVNTVHSTLKSLKAYINIAIKKDIIRKNPFDQVKVIQLKTERVHLTKEDLSVLWKLYCEGSLSKAKQGNLRHFLFMCFTGLRISDFKRLTKYNISNNTLVFTAEKTRHLKRTMIKIPLTAVARLLIAQEDSLTDKLFNPVSEQKLNTYIKDICTGAKLKKKVTIHSARHTFATLFLKQTKDLAALQLLLGHSRITDTMVYVHISDEDIRSSMDNFKPVE